MSRRANRPAVPRAPLSRERVLQTAIGLADRGGIDSLSMRRLAEELDVEAMSLYYHVANKDAILDGIIDAVAGEIELPSDAAGWKAALRGSAISARAVLRRHHWASGLWMSHGNVGRSRLRYVNWTLQTLREAGFSAYLTHHALHVLESYILGVTLQYLSFPYKGEELASIATSFLDSVATDEYPYLVEHIKLHLEPRPGDDGGFALGLDLILDGLELIRDTNVGPPSEP